GRAGELDGGRGQPRPRPVPRAGPARRGAGRAAASVVRARSPLLPGGGPGAAGRTTGDRGAGGAVPGAAPDDRGAGVETEHLLPGIADVADGVLTRIIHEAWWRVARARHRASLGWLLARRRRARWSRSRTQPPILISRKRGVASAILGT